MMRKVALAPYLRKRTLGKGAETMRRLAIGRDMIVRLEAWKFRDRKLTNSRNCLTTEIALRMIGSEFTGMEEALGSLSSTLSLEAKQAQEEAEIGV
jgi:hypothetical protein